MQAILLHWSFDLEDTTRKGSRSEYSKIKIKSRKPKVSLVDSGPQRIMRKSQISTAGSSLTTDYEFVSRTSTNLMSNIGVRTSLFLVPYHCLIESDGIDVLPTNEDDEYLMGPNALQPAHLSFSVWLSHSYDYFKKSPRNAVSESWYKQMLVVYLRLPSRNLPKKKIFLSSRETFCAMSCRSRRTQWGHTHENW